MLLTGGAQDKIAEGWIAKGATADVVIAAVAHVMRNRKNKDAPHSLKYFDNEVCARLQKPKENLAWNRAIDAWRRGGCRGEPPKLPDFEQPTAHHSRASASCEPVA